MPPLTPSSGSSPAKIFPVRSSSGNDGIAGAPPIHETHLKPEDTGYPVKGDPTAYTLLNGEEVKLRDDLQKLFIKP